MNYVTAYGVRNGLMDRGREDWGRGGEDWRGEGTVCMIKTWRRRAHGEVVRFTDTTRPWVGLDHRG